MKNHNQLMASVITLLRKNRIRANKKMGQHFLISNKMLDKIIEFSDVHENDVVIEPAAGPGILTEKLLQVTRNVIPIEKDPAMIRLFIERLADPTIKPIEGDILKIDFSDFVKSDSRILLIGNLPYQIATIFILKILEKRLPLSQISVMIQDEVARRLVASPGSKDYGSLSIHTQFYADVISGPVVPARCFYPEPKVCSRFVKLIPKEHLPFSLNHREFMQFVRKVFQYRRKQIARAVGFAVDMPINDIRGLFISNRWDMTLRPENLDMNMHKNIFDGVMELKDRT